MIHCDICGKGVALLSFCECGKYNSDNSIFDQLAAKDKEIERLKAELHNVHGQECTDCLNEGIGAFQAMQDKLRAAEEKVKELESNLTTNAKMLAKQTDLAREAETRITELLGEINLFPGGDTRCRWNNGKDCWIDTDNQCVGVELCPNAHHGDKHKAKLAELEKEDDFSTHLKKASKIVDGWPEWKRNVLRGKNHDTD